VVANFEAFRARLAAEGFDLSGESRHPEAFGSWLLTVRTQPPTEIVWDGRDGWLILRRDGADVWIAKDEADQTPDAVIARLG